jgi:hypothetical protein
VSHLFFGLFYLYDTRTRMAQRHARLASNTSAHDAMLGRTMCVLPVMLKNWEPYLATPCMSAMPVSAPWCAALDNLPSSPPLPYLWRSTD